uniref:Uncharacterized protein n=1 Tax=Physcomitrium patens TaxID=3218 RepID=A0A2K1IRM5_PHYPA|nr:hypothetical protein PHYPA_026054 [Physcomitrium patens]
MSEHPAGTEAAKGIEIGGCNFHPIEAEFGAYPDDSQASTLLRLRGSSAITYKVWVPRARRYPLPSLFTVTSRPVCRCIQRILCTLEVLYVESVFIWIY